MRRVGRETRLNPRRTPSHRSNGIDRLQTCVGRSGRSLTVSTYDLITGFGKTCCHVLSCQFRTSALSSWAEQRQS